MLKALRTTAGRCCIVTAILMVAGALPSAAQQDKAKTFSLSAGEAAFWDGPVGPAPVGEPYTYRLNVTERGYRLRIGIDRPTIGDIYTVVVEDPKGNPQPEFSPESGLYSAELLVRNPQPGMWKIAVHTETVSRASAFRMRAKLEAGPPPIGTKAGPVLPNLQVLPPHDLSFLLPVTNGSTDGEPVGANTNGIASCHPEEHAEDGAVKCLRFGFGVRNTGNGPLHLILGSGAELQDRDLIQRVERGDGSHFERPAGTAKYHKTHGHYHHDAAIGLRLYKVTEETGSKRLEPAGPMRTKGFAHREELLRDWERFYPTWDPVPFGLRAGWADIYEWDRPGNYIDFGLNGDGYYVIRMWADPVDGILESNEKDNVAYAYLRVENSAADLIEVGRGKDPWDKCKILMGEGGHPDPEPRHQPRRARNCPPDTT